VTPRTASRLKLLGFALVALLPVVGSYVLYLVWEPQGHMNYGELLQPTPVASIELPLLSGEPFRFEQLRGRWVLVTAGGGACNAGCVRRLWTLRQVRRALGQDAARVERVWLIDDAATPDADLREAYAGTWMVRAGERGVLNALPDIGSNDDSIYLIDPLGNLILRYPSAPDAKAMIKDLARLLRYSRIG